MLCVIFRSASTPKKGYRLNRSRDSLLRDTGFILGSTPAPGVGGGAPASTIVEAQAAYAYSATDGRIAQISNPQISNQTFSYAYTPNSNLLATVTGPIHTVINEWEPTRDVLDTKTNKLAITVISKYDYAVNAIGQRTGVATSGTAYPAVPSWLWSYDALGQVTGADSSVATSDRAYQYDAIGNRIEARDGVTTATGTPNYTANALKQYTSFPSLASVPSYDFDGNMTSGPLPVSPTTNSTLLWDGENRLTEVKNSTGTTIEKNVFDSGSRKIATTANGITTLYLYDGWNCIAEYQGDTGVSPVLKKTRLWGSDLSGSMQGAGGVGGMLSESSPITSNPITFNSSYPTYDGNGNVSEYLDSTGQVIAHYEYDPFGNTVVNTDTSNQFAYRFSTKPLAFATGLYYYGYRYYDPLTGRWPSRDPIEERGGMNLYGFVGNDGVNKLDVLGLDNVGPEIRRDWLIRLRNLIIAGIGDIWNHLNNDYEYTDNDNHIFDNSMVQDRLDIKYKEICRRKHPGDGTKKTITVDAGESVHLSLDPLFDTYTSDFWLGSTNPDAKSKSGSFDCGCLVAGKYESIEISNRKVYWVWNDIIDANPNGARSQSYKQLAAENAVAYLEFWRSIEFNVKVHFTDER